MMASQPEGAQAAQKSMRHSEKPQPGSQEHTELERTFFLTECAVLHDEINTRMEQRGNLFTFTIITAGSLLSLGAAANAQIALFYPILSLFLAAAWSDEDGKIGSLGAYLHDQEARHGLSGWSSYHRPHKRRSGLLGNLQKFYPTSLLGLATRGVFLSTQALAILVGVTNALAHSQLASIWPLLSVALLAMILTAVVIRHKRGRALEQEMRER
ncbi:MAG TPA: hypothetical protein VGF67_23865 [Ktedonobacteraceae bacterium]|jgi:hypothetical protein